MARGQGAGHGIAAPRLAFLPLDGELPADEPDGYDPVLLRRGQQSLARTLARGVILELDLIKAGEGGANVCLVVDRQPSLPLRINVGEGGVRELGASLRTEPRHRSPFSQTPPSTLR